MIGRVNTIFSAAAVDGVLAVALALILAIHGAR